MMQSVSKMMIASASTTEVGRGETALELVNAVRGVLEERTADLCVLFASAHYEEELQPIAELVAETLRPRAFLGTTAEAIIADDRELENQPGLALWAAHLPGVRSSAFHLSQNDLEEFNTPEALREQVGVAEDANPYFVLIGDPFSINPLDLLDRFNTAYGGRPAIGGMASAGEQPGQNLLVFDGQTLRTGAVGVALWGNVVIDPIVSQGCRPIGRHMVITRAERNVIYTLGGKSPLNAVNEMLQECPQRDIELAKRRGLLVGRVINEYQKVFNRGDFLIRNPINFDASTGALMVNDYVRTGQTVQFHVRDGASAAEDLSLMLGSKPGGDAAGALLFSCNGRGTRLFDDRHHDARAVATARGRIPAAGFFCAGEIGPVGARNFLHGHTASIGLFRPAEAAPDAR